MPPMNNVYIYANFGDRKFVTLELASNVVVVGFYFLCDFGPRKKSQRRIKLYLMSGT